jgi:hypothetical protein
MRSGKAVDEAVRAIRDANVDLWVCRDLARVDTTTRQALRTLHVLTSKGAVREEVVTEVAAVGYENIAGVARHQGAPAATAAYAAAARRLFARTRLHNLAYRAGRLDIAVASTFVKHGPLRSARYLVRRNAALAGSPYGRLRIEQRTMEAQLAAREGDAVAACAAYDEHRLIVASDRYDSTGMRAVRRLDLGRHLLDSGGDDGRIESLVLEAEALLLPAGAAVYGAAHYNLHLVSARWCLRSRPADAERHLDRAAALAQENQLSLRELTGLVAHLLGEAGGTATAGPATA